MSKQFVFLCLLILRVGLLHGQCPVSSFDVADASVCPGTNIQFANNSTGASNYYWDFCSGDLANNPTSSLVATLSSIGSFDGLKIVRNGANYFGFIKLFS